MKNEEITVMNEEAIDEVETVEVEIYDEYPETSGRRSVIGPLAIVGGAIGAGIALYKNRDRIATWIEHKRIRRLEKKGYVVSRPGVEDIDYAHINGVDVE